MLHHLEHAHRAELVACVRLHGLPEADWAFPAGPVGSLRDVPASIRTALTCGCESARHRR